MAYISIYLIGTIFVQLALGLNMFISCQGQAATAMLSVLIGAVCNIILDPLFIFTFNMGIKGAALATIISQGISAITVVFNYGLKKYGGDLYIGSITVLQSIMQLIFIPLQGFTQGVQPIISYNLP